MIGQRGSRAQIAEDVVSHAGRGREKTRAVSCPAIEYDWLVGYALKTHNLRVSTVWTR